MKSPSFHRPEDIEGIFRQVLDVIHYALVSHYRLTEEEAKGAEEDLRTWCRRFARRGGVGQVSSKVIRTSLLSAACQYGRSFQLWKLGDASADPELTATLARRPDDLAADLDREFRRDRS